MARTVLSYTSPFESEDFKSPSPQVCATPMVNSLESLSYCHSSGSRTFISTRSVVQEDLVVAAYEIESRIISNSFCDDDDIIVVGIGIDI